MNDQKQFETMAIIRAYAKEVAEQPSGDIRPSTARLNYEHKVRRMNALLSDLDTKS